MPSAGGAGRGDPGLEPYASGSMLDFAITILLALLGMVLYLYLVTSNGASGVHLRRAARLGGDARDGESHGSSQEREPTRPSCATPGTVRWLSWEVPGRRR